MSPLDPNSYARADLVRTTHISWEAEVDFEKKILAGSVILSMEKVDTDLSSVILDGRNLTINKVWLLGRWQQQELYEYDYGSPTGYGEKLEIQLPSFPEQEFRIKISYASSSTAAALSWLTPAQTAGKKQPFMFSQCQPVNCRSMLPIQVDNNILFQIYSKQMMLTALTVAGHTLSEGDLCRPHHGPRRADRPHVRPEEG